VSLSEETLMAFADGELDREAREQVERAMREDPAVAQQIARHIALRARVQQAFAAQLQEPVPERLLLAARGGAQLPNSNVVSLDHARSARAAAPSGVRTSGLRSWGALAASVLLGVALGFALFRPANPQLMQTAGGALVAQGQLGSTLTGQLSADQPSNATVRVGISFLAKTGEYCRSFSLTAANSSGIACRHGKQWQIDALVQQPRGLSNEYRTAATDLPPVLRETIEATISGDALDATAEAMVRQRGWQ
jgi:hypothetical protein